MLISNGYRYSRRTTIPAGGILGSVTAAATSRIKICDEAEKIPTPEQFPTYLLYCVAGKMALQKYIPLFNLLKITVP